MVKVFRREVIVYWDVVEPSTTRAVIATPLNPAWSEIVYFVSVLCNARIDWKLGTGEPQNREAEL